VTRRADVTFQAPVVGDEAFTISSHVVAFDEVDCRVRCEMHKANGSLAATCDLTLVCVSKETRKPSPWSSEFVARFYE
jgi:acyl-CoA thioesterase FadM